MLKYVSPLENGFLYFINDCAMKEPNLLTMEQNIIDEQIRFIINWLYIPCRNSLRLLRGKAGQYYNSQHTNFRDVIEFI